MFIYVKHLYQKNNIYINFSLKIQFGLGTVKQIAVIQSNLQHQTFFFFMRVRMCLTCNAGVWMLYNIILYYSEKSKQHKRNILNVKSAQM